MISLYTMLQTLFVMCRGYHASDAPCGLLRQESTFSAVMQVVIGKANGQTRHICLSHVGSMKRGSPGPVLQAQPLDHIIALIFFSCFSCCNVIIVYLINCMY